MENSHMNAGYREPYIDRSCDGVSWFIVSMAYESPRYLWRDLKFRIFEDGRPTREETGGICYYKSKREAEKTIRKWEKAYP